MSSETKRNKWHKLAISTGKKQDWPLALDLARHIGGKGWWQGVFSLSAGLMLALYLGFAGSGTDTKKNTSTITAAHADTNQDPAIPDDTYPGITLSPLLPEGLPAATLLQEPAPLSHQLASTSRSITIGRGDTMIDALLRAGASRLDAHGAIAALSDLFNPRKLRVGQAIDLVFSSDDDGSSLHTLALRTRFNERVVAERTEHGAFTAARQPMAVTPLMGYGSGTIDDSLYLSAQRAGVPAKVIVEMIRLYSFNVDFQREIRSGDQFEVLYERDIAEEDGLVEDGNILYARLKLGNRDIPLYRHTPSDSEFVDYFDTAGNSVRKALMKTPLDGARLTSRFGKRKHPVLGYVRSHQGADFGAPTGTPVYAAGNGVVERASRFGSYGNYILIRHNDTYKTAYAHLSRYGKGIRQGVRVEQGQVIGYVGATGRVTGPHLHYEVYVGKNRVDPLTLDLPSGRELAGATLKAFEHERASRDRDINTLSQATNIVLAARRAETADAAL